MTRIHKSSEAVQNKPFFHIPFWQAPAADVFARRAERLRELAAQEPSEWKSYLALLAQVCDAQQSLLAECPAVPSANSDPNHFRLPETISADFWQSIESLFTLLHTRVAADLPPAAENAWQRLLAMNSNERLALALRVLRQKTAETDDDVGLWVHAVLQVVWTHSAMRLAENELPENAVLPREERSVCPCCGNDAVGSVIISGGEWDNLRYLHCALCNSRWNALRAKCTFCGNTKDMSLQSIEDAQNGTALSAAYGECCESCHGYRKGYRLGKQTNADPIADDLASLILDMLLVENGYLRGGGNPFLLTGTAGK
ncbi:formate dehydrogenase accessory protein FdhE [Stenoxybacter acetivorans]|uniref:formate dehydrogenase accessory protein FdhE n=1 Tax=Stenoxybacter acetivorans TaxID=422441 RepID=UPI000564BE23|nr:formate dehydrogenase accessory protein FdhE [Stenoxybacter acetivorans]